MPDYIITESSIHYITGFLQRYSDKYPTKKHADALLEMRGLSNLLIESLQMPKSISIVRHNLRNK